MDTHLFWDQKVKGQENIAGVGHCILVSAGFFLLILSSEYQNYSCHLSLISSVQWLTCGFVAHACVSAVA